MSIPESDRNEIRHLKAAGLSKRKIAQVTGHSRNTVAKVLNGEADEARHRERAAREELARAPSRRCPHCGRIGKMPCCVYLAENYWRLNHKRSPRAREGEVIDRSRPLGLQLHNPERARYEEIHDRKVQRGEVPWR